MKLHDVVIAGYAEIPNRLRSGRSAYDLAGEVLASLLARYGRSLEDIDGLSATTSLSEGTNPFYAPWSESRAMRWSPASA